MRAGVCICRIIFLTGASNNHNYSFPLVLSFSSFCALHRFRRAAGGGVSPLCVVLVCSRRCLLADRHSLPFPWTRCLHWRRSGEEEGGVRRGHRPPSQARARDPLHPSAASLTPATSSTLCTPHQHCSAHLLVGAMPRSSWPSPLEKTHTLLRLGGLWNAHTRHRHRPEWTHCICMSLSS